MLYLPLASSPVLPVFCVIHTPSFQPAIGMIPMTETEIRQMVRVAMNPTMRFWVAMIRMGRATLIPMMMPSVADDAKVYKVRIMKAMSTI